uniref:NIDO domain-containing protein n=1 Tax=Electrophorus electricus TaxID=8005 RepID=A0A4W4G598_ELEEL
PKKDLSFSRVSQVKFIYIALFTTDVVTKQLYKCPSPSHQNAFVFIASATLPVFYPFDFGAGDIFNIASDDGSSSVINLLRRFSFFGNTYSQIYVNNNGFLTFEYPSSQCRPYIFLPNQTSGADVIDINQYFPKQIFTASWVFVATWDKVAYYLSFVLMNYGDIAPTAGYDTKNSTQYYIILCSDNSKNVSDLTYSSNVNVTGRWAFIVNSNPSVHLNQGTHLMCTTRL